MHGFSNAVKKHNHFECKLLENMLSNDYALKKMLLSLHALK